MADEIKQGDLVKLKSGGPVMTVDYVGDYTYCAYFLDGVMKEVKLNMASLTKAE